MPKSQRNWDQDGSAAFVRLRQHLQGVAKGAVAQPAEIIQLLQACWNQFEGSAEEITTGKKLWRAKALAWDPPILSFTIARHGAGPAASPLETSPETLHEWEVDVDTQTATLIARRQP